MASIKIIMKDGTVKDFPHEGRPGGSYTKKIRYEGCFAVVVDEWMDEIAIPAADIAEIRTKSHDY